MPKLTDTQLVILSAAAKRENRAILPLPKSLKCNKGAVAIVLKSLLGRGLVTETSAAANEPAWREEDDQRFGLALAEAGLQVLGIEPATSKAQQPKLKPNRNTKDQKSGARTGTKLSALIDLLKRKNGATIPDIAAATGWQSHSVRGAISGALKKKWASPSSLRPRKVGAECTGSSDPARFPGSGKPRCDLDALQSWIPPSRRMSAILTTT